MAGNPQSRAAVPRTVLEQVLWGQEYTYEELAGRFEEVANRLGEKATITPRHLRRLAAGERPSATPATRRVLQAMFGCPVDRLLSSTLDAVSTPPYGNSLDAEQGMSGLEPCDRKALQQATQRAHGIILRLSTTNVNGETMDQIYDDVSSLTVSYQRESPSSVIGRLIQTQDQIFELLEGRQAPAHTRDLLLLAGVTSGLLGKISHDLTDSHTAMTHSRTAYLCADNADHNGLRVWVRSLQSLIAYWAGRYGESARYAQHGASIAASGTARVWLHLSEARATAALGNVEAALVAIQRAEDARDDVQLDELDGLGGVCTFSTIRQLYYTADALAWLPSEARSAESYAQRAVEAYADDSSTDWAFGDAAGSAANLAVARIHRGEIEGGAEALRSVLALPSEKRINGIVASVTSVYKALRDAPVTEATKELQEHIEIFTARPLRAITPKA